ncbi:MAG: YdcF family protein [Geminicoccaceae bacterium]
MDFALSKLIWLVVKPSTGLLIACWLGVISLALGWQRLGRLMLGLGLIGFTLALVTPLPEYVLGRLENRFPALHNDLPDAVDGIIMLGGALETLTMQERDQVSLNEASERLSAFVYLARQYPHAKLVFTGGSGLLLAENELSEADVVRRYLGEIGFDADRVIFEEASRNTQENVLNSKALVQPQPGERWVLVTSAYHMPRSVGIFRRQDWPVMPYPVDYQTGAPFSIGYEPSLASKLKDLDRGVHEFIGLTAYYLLGRTSAWFPAPEPGQP